jgi:methyltransferase (TIGR00027 family)
VREGEPSRTAWGAAVQRALHQNEPPAIFTDPLAWRILGDDVDTSLWEGSRLRVFIAVRHRFAEDALADAVRRGVRQLVVLGAGLDTLAYRLPYDDVRVWEVDHPDTQAHKRSLVTAAGLEGQVTYVPVDFERASFLDSLVAGGFSASAPAFFVWLGVVPYLTRPAVETTLRAIAAISGAEVVLDYANPLAAVPDHERAEQDLLRTRVADLGEPLQAGWETPDLHALLRACGFAEIEDLGRPEIRVRYLGKPPGPGGAGGHVLRARVVSGP